MLHFKSCPKCLSGALNEYSGLDGKEKKCVNCAFTIYLDGILLPTEQETSSNIVFRASA